MNDQADALRGIMRNRFERQTEQSAERSASAAQTAWTIAVTSGKGGVGKTNVALSLAIALARRERRICILDASLGLGNIDLLCGLNGYWNLSHVLTGARQLEEILLRGPGGITVIPGAAGLQDPLQSPASRIRELMRQWESLETSFDFLIIDTGTGCQNGVRQFVAAADTTLLLTTPEPTSVADAYAKIKSLSNVNGIEDRLEILVNMGHSEAQAEAVIDRLRQTSALFLRTQLRSAGWIPRDPAVVEAVCDRQPVQVYQSDCPAALAIDALADQLDRTIHGYGSERSLFLDRLLGPELQAA